MKDLIKGLNENRVSNSLVGFFFFTFDTYMLTKWFCKEIIMQSRFMERKKYSKILGMPFWQLHIWFLILGWLWRPMGLLYYGCIDFLSVFWTSGKGVLRGRHGLRCESRGEDSLQVPMARHSHHVQGSPPDHANVQHSTGHPGNTLHPLAYIHS